MRHLMISIVVGVLIAPALASADREKKESKDLSEKTVQWLEEVTRLNMVGLQMAEIAHGKTETDEVKSFAEDVKGDREMLSSMLERIAKEHEITLPSELNEEQKKQVSELEGVEAKEIDKAFLTGIRENYKQTLTELQKGKKVNEKIVKVFSESAIPYVRYRHDLAQTHLKKLATRPAGPAEQTPGVKKEEIEKEEPTEVEKEEPTEVEEPEAPPMEDYE